MIKRILTVFAVLLFTFARCAQNNSEHSISVSELRKAIKTDSTLVILDVRTPAELTGPLGAIKGAINIPLQELEDRLPEFEKYKEKNIAVICRSGNRSRIATAILLEHHFKAKNVLGGMREYNKKVSDTK